MSRQRDLARAMRRMVSEEDLRQIVARLVQRARAGDPAAVQLLLEYGIGLPPSAPEPTGQDLDEHDRH